MTYSSRRKGETEKSSASWRLHSEDGPVREGNPERRRDDLRRRQHHGEKKCQREASEIALLLFRRGFQNDPEKGAEEEPGSRRRRLRQETARPNTTAIERTFPAGRACRFERPEKPRQECHAGVVVRVKNLRHRDARQDIRHRRYPGRGGREAERPCEQDYPEAGEDPVKHREKTHGHGKRQGGQKRTNRVEGTAVRVGQEGPAARDICQPYREPAPPIGIVDRLFDRQVVAPDVSAAEVSVAEQGIGPHEHDEEREEAQDSPEPPRDAPRRGSRAVAAASTTTGGGESTRSGIMRARIGHCHRISKRGLPHGPSLSPVSPLRRAWLSSFCGRSGMTRSSRCGPCAQALPLCGRRSPSTRARRSFISSRSRSSCLVGAASQLQSPCGFCRLSLPPSCSRHRERSRPAQARGRFLVLLATSPLVTAYAAEARAYAVLALGSLALFLLACRGEQTRERLALTALAAVVLLYLHYLALFVVIAVATSAFLLSRRRASLAVSRRIPSLRTLASDARRAACRSGRLDARECAFEPPRFRFGPGRRRTPAQPPRRTTPAVSLRPGGGGGVARAVCRAAGRSSRKREPHF